jgi:hypothetical protein
VKIVAYGNYTDQSLLKDHGMHLTTERPFASFQLHPKVNCTTENMNGQTGLKIAPYNRERKLTIFLSIQALRVSIFLPLNLKPQPQ